MIQYSLTLKQVAYLPDIDPEIWFQCFQGTEDPNDPYAFTHQTGFLQGPNMIPIVNHIKIGEPGVVKPLSDYTTGNLDELPPPPGGGVLNLLIKGPIDVDVDYIFGGESNIYIDGDVPIRILPDRVFTLKDDARVRGCIETWRGLEVLDYGTLKLDGTTWPATSKVVVSIEDAQTAVTLNDNAALLCKAVDFLNNYAGVYTIPNATGLNSINLQLQQSRFRVEQLKSPYLATGPGIAGVVLNDLGLVVIGYNSFQNYTEGIQANNTNLLTAYDDFEDILKVGINAKGQGQLLWQVGKENDHGNPNFFNCNTGILVDNMHVLHIRNNAMQKVAFGVNINGGSALSKDYSLHDNDIQASDAGIWLKNIRTRRYGKVYDNSISMNGNTVQGTAIRGDNLKGIKGGNLTDTRWYGNDLLLADAGRGLSLQFGSFLNISGNSVASSEPWPMTGLFLADANYGMVTCNLVQGFTTIGIQQGMEVANLLGTDIACNALSNVRHGIQFNGINSLTNRIRGNALEDFYFEYGWLNIAGATTGEQAFTGNRWLSTPPPGGFGLVHWGNEFETKSSQLTVDADGEPGDETWYSSPEYTASGEPLLIQAEGNNYQCASELNGCPPAVPPVQNEYVSDLDVNIARGSYTFSAFGEAQSWTARRMLYRKLLDNPALVSSGTAVDTFMQVEANTTVGAFETLINSLEQILTMDSANAAYLGSVHDTLWVLSSEIATLDSLVRISTDSAEVDSLFAFREGYIRVASGWASVLDSLENDFSEGIRTAAVTLRSTNAAIQDTALYETNQKSVNDSWLNQLASGYSSPDSAQTAQLRLVAAQCPLSGGPAVYQARALLGDLSVYSDSALCAGPQPIIAPPVHHQPLEVLIHPNPASDYLAVGFSQPAAAGTATVHDLMGRQVLEQSFVEGSEALLLDTSRLPAGSYILSVQAGPSFVSRLFVLSK